MNFYKLILLLLIFAMAESRIEDFIIKNKNDLKRFGDYEDENYADNELSDDYGFNLEILPQFSPDERNIIDMLMEGSLKEMPTDLLQKLQQYYEYTNMESPTCLEDEDFSIQSEGMSNAFGINMYG